MTSAATRAAKLEFKRDRIGHNGHGETPRPFRITYMAHAKGWVMVRHPGCMPFAITEKDWLNFPLYQQTPGA